MDQMSARIRILVPIHTGLHYIRETLDSIGDQSRDDWVATVHDDSRDSELVADLVDR